jgi:hypothetical protein
MKKLYIVLLAVFVSASIWSQSPQKMSYQAIIRNSSNALITSTTVGMRISIIQGSTTGTPVYVETQTPSTNSNGLVSLEIGSGTVISGTFSAINWAGGPYFIKTETDITGNTTYSISGISELMSVPYALFSANSAPGPQGIQGLAGKDGINGATGPMGIQGVAGKDGVNGATGLMGIQGVAGKDGIDGATGPMGIQGVAGKDGATGLMGIQGVAGKDGIDGATGPMGIQGIAGKDGATGPMGLQGAAGKDGATGPMGIQGVAGKDGATGPMGIQGVAGTSGSGIVPIFLTKSTNYTIQNSDVTGELYITVTGENATIVVFTLPLAATVGAGKKINITTSSTNFPNKINVQSSGSDSLFGIYIPAGSTIIYPTVNYLPVSISLISDGINKWIINTLY